MTRRGDTIAAIATPPGQGGVAIVRVSGPQAQEIVGSLFRGGDGALVEPRRIYVGRILDCPGGAPIDQVLAFAMPGPRSYTGEDVVEVQCHGGSIVCRRILEAVLAAGARPAAAGEFTKRAFLNGRLDLVQAEAVADLIAARSEAGLRLARSQLEGHLSARVTGLRAAILAARALCEAAIDFSEEDDIAELAPERLEREVAVVRRALEALAQSFERARVRYEGARAVLIGKPNAGKSSLLNALAGRDRAIVTAVAGTTRDVVETLVTLADVPVIVADTAGMRETSDVVEQLGVERSRAALADATCVIAVFDGSRPLDVDDRLVAAAIEGTPVVAALNKSDLAAQVTTPEVSALVGGAAIVEVSALTGVGVEALAAAISAALATPADGGEDEIAIFRVRHRDAVRRAALDLTRAEAALAERAPAELVASDLGAAAAELGSITGEVTSEEILDRVFAEFCIGK